MKIFKIMTLGASGAGKTVFLASMFKALSTQQNANFKLHIEDPQKRKLLNSIYTQILTGETWPAGTRDISEWTFTCQVQTEDLDHYNACQFTYFDYAGGRLTDGEKDPELEKIIQQSDIVLGLLDGHKVYEWLQGNETPQTDVFLNTDLANILDRAQKLTVPVHFIITKWDLLDRKIPLSRIREKLLTIPDFAQLIRIQGGVGSVVRLIPVSAIGLEFATLQPDGSMRKNSGKVPAPFLLEVPISCVLPDRLQQLHNEKQLQEQQLEKQIQKIDSGNLVVDVLLSGLDVLDIGLNGVDLLFNNGSPESMITRDLAQLASRLNSVLKIGVKGVHEKMSKAGRSKKETTLKFVRDERSALVHAINVFYEFEREFIDRFPDSRLV